MGLASIAFGCITRQASQGASRAITIANYKPIVAFTTGGIQDGLNSVFQEEGVHIGLNEGR